MRRTLLAEAIFVTVLAVIVCVVAASVSSAFLLTLGVLVLACGVVLGVMGLRWAR